MNPFRAATVIAVTSILLVVSTFGQQDTQTSQRKKGLTNQDIVSMVNIKFSDSTILKTIQVNETNFDLSAGALVLLKKAGVSQAIIDAMLATSGSRKEDFRVATANQTSAEVMDPKADLLGEVGVYVVQGKTLVSMEPEIVNWRTGGVLKSIATAGLDKGHVNGTVSGPSSKLNIAAPPTLTSAGMVFYIHCLEGVSAGEYQLLKLWQKENRREFRAVTGGVFHASGGAQDNVVPFKYEKVASRIYKIEVQRLEFGEYGFLAPGAVASANAASQGKMFTFRIIE